MSKPGLATLFGDRTKLFGGSHLPRTPLIVHGDPRRLRALAGIGEFRDIEKLIATHAYPVLSEFEDGMRPTSPDIGVSRYREGAPMILARMCARIPQLREWACAIARDLGHAPTADTMEAIAFFAGEAEARTATHFDSSDVVVVQLTGQKRWTFAPNEELSSPLSNCRSVSPQLPTNSIRRYFPGPFHAPTRPRVVVLRPGSVLFLPRGYWHGTEYLGPSFSLSFAFVRPFHVDLVIDRIRHMLDQSPDWQAAAAGMRGTTTERKRAVQHLKKLLVKLPESMGTFDGSELITGYRTRHRAFGAAAIPVFRRSRRVRCQIKPSARGAAQIRVVSSGGETILEVSPDERRLGQWILDRQSDFDLRDAINASCGLSRRVVSYLLGCLVEAGALTAA